MISLKNDPMGHQSRKAGRTNSLLFIFIKGDGLVKFKKYASTKAIAILMSVLLVIGSFFTQQHKINELQKELYIQENMTDQRYNYTETQIDISTLKERMNKECNFKVLDGTINIKHTYVYQRDSVLGLKSKYKLVGTADFYYALTVNLVNAEITKATKNKITIEVPRATIDTKACHRVANTFVRMDDECDDNILANKTDTEKATRQWEDTFDTKGLQYVQEYFNYADVQYRAEQATVHQIKALLEELGYSQSLEVIVK